MLICSKSGRRGEYSPAPAFLVWGYGKKSNFRGGTPNLSKKPERDTVGIVMFDSGKVDRSVFLIIAFQGDKESGLAWYHSTPRPDRNITVPTLHLSDLMRRFGVPPRKFDFLP